MAQQQGWTAGPAPESAWTPGAAPGADFSTSNATDEQGTPLVRGLQSAYQASPFNIPAAFEFLKHAEANPESVVVEFLKSQGGQFVKAWDDLKSNRPFDAATHVLYGLTPGIGPALDAAKEQDASGDRAGAVGTVIGALSNLAIPEAIKKLPAIGVPASKLRPVNPAEAAAVDFGRQRGVPIDAATATGNKFVGGVQKLADESLGGSFVAERAKQGQADALRRVGDELADQVRPSAITPEQAGQGVREALDAKGAAHKALADNSYDTVRTLEADPAYQTHVPLPPAAVDKLDPKIQGQLRRIVHEMDAAPYEPYRLRPTAKGGGMEHVEGTGGAGAKVFDDIVERLDRTTNPSRGTMQASLEDFLGGGKESDTVRAAIKVAEERNAGKGGRTVSLPEMPPSAMDVLTRLEKGRKTHVEMGLPVELADVKRALKPVRAQMERQLPVTQRDANPGLNVVRNIIDGPDYAPLSQVDRDLSVIKKLARTQGGLAKYAAAKLEAAVQRAAQNGGDEVTRALETGRGAVRAQAATKELVGTLPSKVLKEGVPVFQRATAAKDAGIELLRAVQQHTPQALPQLARAKLEELLAMAPDKAMAEWSKVGRRTREILYPQAGQSQALDHFFLLAKRIAANPNPSGSGHIVALAGQAGALGTGAVMAVTNPPVGLTVLAGQGTIQIGAAALSKLLHSPAGVKAVTQGLTLSLAKASPAAQAASAARILSIARDLEILPAAAQGPGPDATGGSKQ